jgi:TatD DNase family protein
MNLPQPGDYIDMHTHAGKPADGLFIIDCLMAHEDKLPGNEPGKAYTFGIHPWFLNEENHKQLICSVERSADSSNMIAIGEAGFDKLRGPSLVLQRQVFEEQVSIAEAHLKPVIIHCVKAWDDLLEVQKRLKPTTPWMIHGFRGNVELANQLVSKGMYLSFWFDFVIRPESSDLIKRLPVSKIFLETDGADVDIRDIYKKVAKDLDLSAEEMKSLILTNFKEFFSIKKIT